MTDATTEPTEIAAGTTLRWRRAFSLFPASDGWALSYAIRGPDAAEIEVDATADGDAFAVEVPASLTSGWTAGRYAIAGYVERDEDAGGPEELERHLVYRGTLVVLEDLAAVTTPHDPRSHARRVLEAIEAVIEKRASRDQESYTINGRTLVRTPIAELIRLRDRYKGEVAGEEAAERIAAGLGSRRTIRVRFGRG